MTNI